MRSSTLGQILLGTLFCAALLAASPAKAAETIDGIRCDRMEGSAFHTHQHVAIFDHGQPVPIPNDVGRPLLDACYYWIHTHTPDGIVHIESPVVRTFTLENFFDVWGEPLSTRRVASATVVPGELRVFVDGTPYAGDPRAIELLQHTDIVIEVGSPYRPPVPFADWHGQ